MLNCVLCCGEACYSIGELACCQETSSESILKLQACGNLLVQSFWCLDTKSFGCKDKSILRGLFMCLLNRANKRWIICQILAGLLQLFVNYGVAATLRLAKDRAPSCVHSGLATGFRRRKKHGFVSRGLGMRDGTEGWS